MNKSRLMLLIGALVSVTMLTGCGVAGKMLNTASSILGGVAGDRSNAATAVAGQVGDFYGAVGKELTKSEPGVSTVVAEAPAELTESSAPTPMVAELPAVPVPVVKAKLPPAKKTSSIKTVAAVQPAASAAKKK